jgi:hypothetical protein
VDDGQANGPALIDDEFDSRPLRPKETVPIMTFAEMSGWSDDRTKVHAPTMVD